MKTRIFAPLLAAMAVACGSSETASGPEESPPGSTAGVQTGGTGGGGSSGNPANSDGGTLGSDDASSEAGTDPCDVPSSSIDGVADAKHPSGQAPPTCVPKGFKTAMIDDFTGTALTDAWLTPGNKDFKASYVDPKQVTVHDDQLDLAYSFTGKAADKPLVGWAQASRATAPVQTYGKYLVRQRVDAVKDMAAALLLWPKAANTWPPEIDFCEDDFGTRHWYSFNHYKHNGAHAYTTNDSTITSPDWHTWGVEWTTASVTYTLDGKAWKVETDPEMIPTIDMYIGFTMSNYNRPEVAGSGHWLVDWVAIYSKL